ncbi:MAG: hypothetical protein ABL957_01415 [Parvularculaceae bacterium]
MARSGSHNRPHASSPERAELRFHAIGAAGDGVAEFSGRQVFAPHTAPGDVAVADIRGDRAEIVSWIERSAQRREPECPHVLQCGGCALQHVGTDAYTVWKRDRIVSALERVGIEALVGDPIRIAAPTRRRATFAVRRSQGVADLGFNARRSSDIARIDECKVLHPRLLASLPHLKRIAASLGAAAFDLSATLCENGIDVDAIGPTLAEPALLASLIEMARAGRIIRLSIDGSPVFTLETPVVTFDGVAATPPPGAFLQASKEGETALIAAVGAPVSGARRVADLFCGIGTFALPLGRAAQVDGFDADKLAIGALNAAAGDAQRVGLTIRAKGNARDLFEVPVSAAELNKYDAVVFDPPRAGARAQVSELAKSRVRLAVGVSCNPETFARDAAILSQGGLKLTEVTPVDQFVYAPHVELVGVFRRR